MCGYSIKCTAVVPIAIYGIMVQESLTAELSQVHVTVFSWNCACMAIQQLSLHTLQRNVVADNLYKGQIKAL